MSFFYGGSKMSSFFYATYKYLFLWGLEKGIGEHINSFSTIDFNVEHLILVQK